MTEQRFTITVLLRTLNAGPEFSGLLEILRRQRRPVDELLVVDSGSTDGTLERAREAGARIVPIERATFSHARSTNLGFREARGEVVAMLSQDAFPEGPEWLERLTAPLADPAVAASFGRHRARPGCFPVERWQIEADYPERLPAGVVYSNVNSAARRSCWVEEPFDESLSISEDRVWALHQQARGRRVVYVPGAAAWHSHKYTIRQAAERCRAEAAARRQAEGVTEGIGLLFKAWPRQVLRDWKRLAAERALGAAPRVLLYRGAQFWGLWQGGRRRAGEGR